MSIFIPFFYIIEEKSTGMYYAGAKWAQDSNPYNFMTSTGYKTSSKIIHTLIENNGLDSFVVRKIKTFSDPTNAYIYETRFLKKVNAQINPRFYNKHNNEKITPGTKEFEQLMMEKFGVANIMQSPQEYEKWSTRFYELYRVTNPYQLPHVKEASLKTRIERYGEQCCSYEFIKSRIKAKYNVDNVSQLYEIKEKKIITTQLHYGVNNPFQSDEIKEKIKQTNIEKYGVDHYAKSEFSKEVYKNVMQEKFGVDNYSKTDKFREFNITRLTTHHSRPIIFIIKQYQSLYKLHFGRGWTNKSDENLQKILNELIQKYGII